MIERPSEKSHFHVVLLLSLVLVFVIFSDLGTSNAAIRDVSGPDQLKEALRSAEEGDTILLAPGTYGALKLDGISDKQLAFAGKVQITASDKDHPPIFDSIYLSHAANVEFSNIVILHHWRAEEGIDTPAFLVEESHDIAVIDSKFSGGRAVNSGPENDGFGIGGGMAFRRCSNISFLHNSISSFYRGATFGNTAHLTVADNELYDLSSDGFDFASVSDAVIARNYMHDFARAAASTAHPDMIQIWTAGTTTPTHDVEIADNFLDQAGGTWTQSIFMGNELVSEKKAGLEMYYLNIRIEGNTIRNSHLHGITIGQSDGVQILHNTLIQNRPQKICGGIVCVPMINVAKESHNIFVTQNIVPYLKVLLMGHPSQWIVEQNSSAQRDNPQAPDYVSHVYVNALVEGPAGRVDLQLLPESEPMISGHGAKQSQFNNRPAKKMFFISSSRQNASGDTQAFDATNLYGPEGKIDTADAKVEWDFGDGSKGSGITVDHRFEINGDYDVKATFTLPGGEKLSANRTIHVGMN